MNRLRNYNHYKSICFILLFLIFNVMNTTFTYSADEEAHAKFGELIVGSDQQLSKAKEIAENIVAHHGVKAGIAHTKNLHTEVGGKKSAFHIKNGKNPDEYEEAELGKMVSDAIEKANEYVLNKQGELKLFAILTKNDYSHVGNGKEHLGIYTDGKSEANNKNTNRITLFFKLNNTESLGSFEKMYPAPPKE